MRHLWLLRHAQAEAQRPGGDDFERSLSRRGRHEAREAGRRLRALQLHTHAPLPDTLLVSPALRTRQTGAIVRHELGLGVEPRYEPSLYAADVDALFAALRSCAGSARSVLLIGHNPGVSELVRTLGAGLDGALGEDPGNFLLPTAGLCSLSVASEDWGGLSADTIQALTLAP